ncbi:MAG: protein phosphatase 2C domain-containing protein [Chloroflexia bacterium]
MAGSAARSGEGRNSPVPSFWSASAPCWRVVVARATSREFVVALLADFQRAIVMRVEVAGASRATMPGVSPLAAVVGDDAASYCQIGDGAIVVAAPDESDGYRWVFWPQHGEYENETVFATDLDAPRLIAVEQAGQAVDEVALFSDGLQRLALHYEGRTAHAPFFLPMFAPVRAADPGRADALSTQLATFLASRSTPAPTTTRPSSSPPGGLLLPPETSPAPSE